MNRMLIALICTGIVVPTSTGLGQPSAPSAARGDGTPVVRASDPRAATMQRMQRPITVELDETRLEDAIKFLKDFTGADLEPLWLDDKSTEGLDKDMLITLSVKEVRAIDFLERILEKTGDGFNESTWQITRSGALEFGPKARLNKHKELKVYDIQDLLFVIPDYAEVPELDLESVLQQGQGGGGGGGGQGGSIFEDEEDAGQPGPSEQERADEILDLIITFVEPDQWQDNGGDGGTIRFYNGTFLINAPDYIHRQLGGYSFWSGSGPAARGAQVGAARRTGGASSNSATAGGAGGGGPKPGPKGN